MNTIGIDIGGTSIRIGSMTMNGTLSYFEKTPIANAFTNAAPEELSAYISMFMDRNDLNGSVRGLCIGLPGTLAGDGDHILSLPNVRGFDGVKLKSFLNDRHNVPVHLLKDVSALFYYDKRRFSIGAKGVAVGCYIGTGIGNAIYIDGKIFGGSNGSAGELGHIPVWGLSEDCGCGNMGCAEILTGGKYVKRLSENTFAKTPIEKIFEKHREHPLLREYVERLASLVATEINILDPQNVILGGGVLNMAGFPLDELISKIRAHARKPFPERNLRFLFSNDEGRNGVMGAALFAWDCIQSKEKKMDE